MPRYWVIAPVEAHPRALFDKVWQFDLANNLISIGWQQLGDVSKLSKEELHERVASTYPEKTPPTWGLITNMIWRFYHVIAPGDVVIARRGVQTLVAVGTVTKSAIYAPARNPHTGHPHFLDVEWEAVPREMNFGRQIFLQQTVQERSEKEYRDIVEGKTPPPPPPSSGDPPSDEEADDPPEPLEPEDRGRFELEKYLEDFIDSKFDTIFNKELKIYEDERGNRARQFNTGAGVIDILAVEPKSKSFVVIELKRGRTSNRVIGQILGYMGWVKENLCKLPGQDVRGLVICHEPDSPNSPMRSP